MTDCKKLELARQWAADIDADRQTLSQDTIDAAADLISSLPDAWVDADTLRKYIADWREGLATAPRGNYEAEMLDDLEDMLPAVPRTMAEIEWDDAEHHLAEAVVAEDDLDGNISDTFIMLGINKFGNISALDTSTWGAWALSRDTLTPTGRKYRLVPDEGVPEGDPIETDDDHAPPAPEAVAEVVRLRRALEELRDHYIDREALSRERLESVTDEREQSYLARFAHSHRRTHEALTRILEGNTDG